MVATRLRSVTAATSILVVALTAGWVPGSASADGDPASDVLVTQTLFLPWDAGVSADQQAQLTALLRESEHDGYPLRVALIASSADLGSVTELWRQPQSYADFLGDELSLVYRGTLLVVMPDGFGLYGVNGSLSPEQAALASMGPADRGREPRHRRAAGRPTRGRRSRPPAEHPARRPEAHRRTGLARRDRLDRVRDRCRADRTGVGW